MTASPLVPTHLLTVGEYADLGEDEQGRTELMEGNLIVSPRPTPDHNAAILGLGLLLQRQLPEGYESIPDIDVDLQLVPADAPGTVRRPDLVIARREARRRVRTEGGLLRADDLVVVIEILSLGSRRIDRIVKRVEYRDAGIAHYWIVDLDDRSLTAHTLVGADYQVDAPVVTFRADAPFPIILDLTDIG